MTEHSAYGSRPEYLPDFMNDSRDIDGRQVVKLSHAESRALEAVSLNRFPATFGAGLDWDSAAYMERRWWSDEEDWERMTADLLSAYVAESRRVVVFCGNLVVPTVTMPTDIAVRHARELLDMEPHFWVYPLAGSVLIECLMDRQVTVAEIPAKPSAASGNVRPVDDGA